MSGILRPSAFSLQPSVSTPPYLHTSTPPYSPTPAALVDRLVQEFAHNPDYLPDETGKVGQEALIPMLHAIQEQFRYLPEDALSRICEATAITPAAVEGVVSFYTQFRRTPVGKHVITVCHGTACHVKGAELIQAPAPRTRIGTGCSPSQRRPAWAAAPLPR